MWASGFFVFKDKGEGRLAAKPSDTFWKATEKVLDGFVKIGGK
jgi:hypothetical protein